MVSRTLPLGSVNLASAVHPLAVKRTSRDGVELLLVEGELDIATAPRLISVLNQAVQDVLHSLVVDLSECGFMDSTGLALLINAHRRLTRRSKGFAVVCPAGPRRRVVESTHDVGKVLRCP